MIRKKKKKKKKKNKKQKKKKNQSEKKKKKIVDKQNLAYRRKVKKINKNIIKSFIKEIKTFSKKIYWKTFFYT